MVTRTRDLRRELGRLERQERIWNLESAFGLTPTSAWDHDSDGAAWRRRLDLRQSIASRRRLRWQMTGTVLVCAVLSVLWLMTEATNGLTGGGNVWGALAVTGSVVSIAAVGMLWMS